MPSAPYLAQARPHDAVSICLVYARTSVSIDYGVSNNGTITGVQWGLRLAYSYVNTGNNNMSCDLNNNKAIMNNSKTALLHIYPHTVDHSRVVLSEVDEQGSDYINASYIKVSPQHCFWRACNPVMFICNVT